VAWLGTAYEFATELGGMFFFFNVRARYIT
jgi:hypothetical protein